MGAAPALDGVRIVDFTQIAAGPYSASLLGDFGADVIKVEPPEGEPFRAIDNIFGANESAYFYGVNRSKRSLTLDLKQPGSRPVVDDLIRSADVCMVGFRPSTTAKLGLDYERLSEINPRLVYCSITAFGETGPRSGQPGMDILAQAISGVMGLTGHPGASPVKVGPPIADYVVSLFAAMGILGALRARDRDGVGDKIELNLLDGQIAILANYVTPYVATGVPIRPVGGGHPQIVPYQVFEARDGYFVLACLSDKFWPRVCAAVGEPAWKGDPRYAQNSGRLAHRKELTDALQARFIREDRAHWLTRLEAGDVPCGPVNRLEEALEDPQVQHNEMLMKLRHPVSGEYTVVNTPLKLQRTPARPRGHAPTLGEHTSDVLTELGYSAEQQGELRDSGVV